MWLAVLERDVEAAAEESNAGITLCREHGMETWFGVLRVGRGWAVAELGDRPAGLGLIHEGIAA
jgi:hypothetical protein